MGRLSPFFLIVVDVFLTEDVGDRIPQKFKKGLFRVISEKTTKHFFVCVDYSLML
jgi:hypothetical protein